MPVQHFLITSVQFTDMSTEVCPSPTLSPLGILCTTSVILLQTSPLSSNLHPACGAYTQTRVHISCLISSFKILMTQQGDTQRACWLWRMSQMMLCCSLLFPKGFQISYVYQGGASWTHNYGSAFPWPITETIQLKWKCFKAKRTSGAFRQMSYKLAVNANRKIIGEVFCINQILKLLMLLQFNPITAPARTNYKRHNRSMLSSYANFWPTISIPQQNSRLIISSLVQLWWIYKL